MMLKAVIIASAMLVGSASYGSGSSGSGSDSDYDLGKRVFQKKLACQSCPAGGQKINKESAAQWLEKMSSGQDIGANLSSRERRLVAHFLEERFKL